jgi:hypothetical protein
MAVKAEGGDGDTLLMPPARLSTQDQILVGAATTLFCVLALLVLLVAAQIALGLMGPICGMVVILGFILIIWLGLWCLQHFLKRSGRLSGILSRLGGEEGESQLREEDVTIDLSVGFPELGE